MYMRMRQRFSPAIKTLRHECRIKHKQNNQSDLSFQQETDQNLAKQFKTFKQGLIPTQT